MRRINSQRTAESTTESRDETRREQGEDTTEDRVSVRVSHTAPPHIVERQQKMLDRWNSPAADARDACEETIEAIHELTPITVEDVSRELSILEAEAVDFSPILPPLADQSLIIVTDTESEVSLGDVRLSRIGYTDMSPLAEIGASSSIAMSSTSGLIAPAIYAERPSRPRAISPGLLSPDRASVSTASPLALPLPTTPVTPATVRNSPLDLRATMNKTPVVIKPPITPRHA